MTAKASGLARETRPAGRPARILIVEDQPELLRALRINLRARHYDVATARTGRDALASVASSPPDAVVLDLGLPDIDGTDVIVEFRRRSRAPIIVLSGRISPGDKIGALDVGADDYVTKPFAMAELLARLRAALRRDEAPGTGRPLRATIGRWLVDLGAHAVTPADGSIPAGGAIAAGTDGEGGEGGADGEGGKPRLTPAEWRILEVLLRRPGQLVGSAQLLTAVWGPGSEGGGGGGRGTSHLRFHMARLRRKLEENPSRPRHLLTEPGMGYRYQP
ncbi:MAG: response regulator transcription factor [Streptosporangiaceae bacterium]|nr:response regulator transcription factor [Streptosporangiaceae bacterium]MBV9856748.1 response regulator transcription factor [Streptosporangiaceae bacterium]